MRRFTITLGICAVMWGSAVGSLLHGEDRIIPFRGRPLTGKILEFNPNEIVLEARDGRQQIATNEVRRVSFDPEPPELRRGRDSITVGQLETGLAELKKVDPAAIERAEVRADLEFYLAYAEGKLSLSGGGDKKAAADKMLAFVRRNANSYHFYQAAEVLGDLAAALGTYDQAARYYSALGRAPWPDFQLRALILEGRALESQNQFAAAQAKFEEVISSEVDTPAANQQKLAATVGRAICLSESGSHQEAIQILNGLIEKQDSADNALFGRIYNALGRCHLKANRPQDALLAYLHTDLLFYADGEVHAEALYHLSKLWDLARKSDRAVSARNLLTDRYAGSRWAKRE